MPLPISNQRTSQRTQVRNRRVADPGKHANPATAGAGFGSLAKAFDAFSGKLSKEEEKQEILRDQEALARMALDINSRPEEAAEAVRSGDYSAFVDANRQARYNFITQAPQLVANSLGYQSAKQFNADLNKMPLDQDPVAAAKSFVDAQIKGMPAMAGLAFSEAFQKGTSAALQTRRTNMEKLATAKAKGSLVSTLETAAELGTLENLDDVYKHTWSIAAAAGGNNVANQLELQTITDETIARLAAHQDRAISDRFNAMLYEKDTKRGGSVADRLGRAKVLSLKDEQLKSYRKAMTARGSQAIAQAANRLAEWKAGVAGPGVNPVSILDSLDSVMEAEGFRKTNKEYGAIYRTVLGEFDSDVTGRGVLALSEKELRDGVSTKEINTAVDTVVRQGGKPLTNPQIVAAVAFSNITKELKAKITNDIISGDAESFALSRTFIKSAMQKGGRGIENFLTDSKALGLYYATEYDSPQEALQRRAQLQDILQARGNAGFDGAFYETWRGITGFSLDAGERNKVSAYTRAGQALFEDKALLKSMGMEGLSWKNIDGVLRNTHIPRVLDIAALAAQVTGDTSMATLRRQALSMLKDDLEVGRVGSDGEPVASKRKSPSFTVDAKGGRTPSVRISPEMGMKFTKLLEEADAVGKLGFMTDERTRDDGTVLMLANNGASLQPFMLAGGQEAHLDKVLAGELGLAGQFVVGDVPGDPTKVIVRTPIPGPDDPKSYQVNAVSSVVYSDIDLSWQVRRAIGPDYAAIKAGEVKAAAEALGVTLGTVDSTVNDANQEIVRTVDDLDNKAATSLATNEWYGRSEDELKKFQADITAQLPSTPHAQRKMLLEQRRMITEALEATQADRFAKEQRAISTGSIAEAVSAGDPRTMTAQALKAELDDIKSKRREDIPEAEIRPLAERAARLEFNLKERARGKPPLTLDSLLPDKAVPGTGLSLDNVEGAERARYNDERREAINKSIQEGVTRGTYHFAAIGAARDASSLEEARRIAEDISLRNGHNKEAVMPDAPDGSFMNDVTAEIINQTTFKPEPVEKNNGVMIGYDFDITREDAEELMEAAGLFKDTLDQEPVTKVQAQALAQVVVSKQEQYLRDEFKDFPLRKHQKRALHSYMASRNEAKLPKTVTENIKRGNTEAAVKFIQASPSFKVLDTLNETVWADAVPKSLKGTVVDMTAKMIARGQTEYGRTATATREPMKFVVFHNTGSPTLKSAFNSMNVFDPGRGFNPGYHAIAAGGKVYLVTPPNKRVNATKRPAVPGQANNNTFQLAFQDKDPETIAAVHKFSQEVLVNRLGIEPDSFVAHGHASNRRNHEGVHEVEEVRKILKTPQSDGANAHRRTKEALTLKGTDRL